MRARSAAALLMSAFLFSAVSAASAQDRWRVDFENGAAISGYNDVRIPGDTGTMFSLTDDLASDRRGTPWPRVWSSDSELLPVPHSGRRAPRSGDRCAPGLLGLRSRRISAGG